MDSLEEIPQDVTTEEANRLREKQKANLLARDKEKQRRARFEVNQALRVMLRRNEIQFLVGMVEKEYAEILKNDRYSFSKTPPYKKLLVRRLKRKLGRANNKINAKSDQVFPEIELHRERIDTDVGNTNTLGSVTE
jgi:hypothetical protein